MSAGLARVRADSHAAEPVVGRAEVRLGRSRFSGEELHQAHEQLAERDRSLREARLAIQEIRVQLEQDRFSEDGDGSVPEAAAQGVVASWFGSVESEPDDNNGEADEGDTLELAHNGEQDDSNDQLPDQSPDADDDMLLGDAAVGDATTS